MFEPINVYDEFCVPSGIKRLDGIKSLEISYRIKKMLHITLICCRHIYILIPNKKYIQDRHERENDKYKPSLSMAKRKLFVQFCLKNLNKTF